MGLGGGVHANSAVRYREQDIGALLNRIGISFGEGEINFGVSGLDEQLAAIGHGIPRIYGQVHDDLFDLSLIGFHPA